METLIVTLEIKCPKNGIDFDIDVWAREMVPCRFIHYATGKFIIWPSSKLTMPEPGERISIRNDDAYEFIFVVLTTHNDSRTGTVKSNGSFRFDKSVVTNAQFDFSEFK